MKQKVKPLQKKPNIKHKTQKWPKPKIVRISHYNCAYVRVMAVLVIFRVFFQTVINLSAVYWRTGGTIKCEMYGHVTANTYPNHKT